MKLSYKALLFAGLISLASCEKKEVDAPAFNVSTTKTTYAPGEPVVFQFSGDPQMITFYSGENGKKYEFRDRIVAQGKPQFEFRSLQQYGTQANTLKVLVSTNFKGVYNAESIAAATWTDITSRLTLSTTSEVPSGKVDLSEWADAPFVFIAFKYSGTTGSTQRSWAIKNFSLTNTLADGSVVPVATSATAGWAAVDVLNPTATANNWSPATQAITGGPATAATNEDWLITKPLQLSKVTPDNGTAISAFSDPISSFEYTYATAGTYKVVFEATNANVHGKQTVVKELEVSIK